MFEIKDWCKLELQTPENMKLFRSTKIIIDKTNNGASIPSIEMVKAVLMQSNLADN